MNFLNPFQMIYMIIITLLLIYDFFPVFFLSDIFSPEVLLGVMIGLFLSVLFKKDGRADHGAKFKEQLLYTFYLLSVVGVLTALGGRSAIGISLNDVFLWIVLLLSCCHIYSYWKKAKQPEI
ncbi:hypothetical protein Q8G35_07555 [Peribacillus simplex]|uniref:Uncharacterized protein n=2 Tax=Peribacillus TaxID=2675229 RepID=A0AA90P2Q0_9BACI|nr:MULTISPECIES: hypothetical protein [Peribacillus]MDP1418264.1 hypothetical protein [Peribacillus simplex]MDP1451141.1 hypothetical protein [Peribacillus frigoritolerans]